MKTTAFFNLKGGVAKTTSVINLAANLATQHGQRVLVIDGDGQCNLTEFFETDGIRCCNTLADMLRDRCAVEAYYYIGKTTVNGVSMIPADDSLMDLDLSKAENGAACLSAVGDLLEAVKHDFDVCLIDCPPAFTAATAAALMAADDVIIPLKMDAFSVRGMVNLMQQVENMKKLNSRLHVRGILPTFVTTAKTSRGFDTSSAAMDAIRGSSFRVFHPIRLSPLVDTMTYAQKPLYECSYRCGATRDYLFFADEFLKGGK